MARLTVREFVDKWGRIQVKEMAAAQSHFNDVCALVGHKKPLEVDPEGRFFTFEAATYKVGGRRGWADVWYKGRFIWEYKGLHANLEIEELDEAVLDAYGWPHTVTDEEIPERLLGLNLERAGDEAARD